MWFTKQSTGYRGWFRVVDDTGALRTGLVAGDFTVTIVDPADAANNSPSVSESAQKTGIYYFDILSAFFVANGNGEYTVSVEVDTFAGPSGFPNVRDAFSTSLQVYDEDFDSIVDDVITAGFQDAVWIDRSSGVAGITGDIGAPWNPVDNLADAVLIAAARNLRKYKVKGAIILQSPHVGWIFEAWSSLLDSIINVNGQNVQDCIFIRMQVSGNTSGNDQTFIECVLVGISNAQGGGFRCVLTSTISITTAVQFYDCQNGGFVPVTFDVSGGFLECRHFSGDLRITGNAGSTVELSMDSGTVELDNTNGGGTVNINGTAVVTDNTGVGCIVTDNTTMTAIDEVPTEVDTELSATHGAGSWEGSTPAQIDNELTLNHGAGSWQSATIGVSGLIQSFWGEQLPGTYQIGSAGNIIGNNLDTTTFINNVENAVWDAVQANHVTAGTFGEVIAFLKAIEEGRWELTDEDGGTWKIYREDNTTLIATFATFDENGARTYDPTKIVKRTRVT